MHYSSPGKKYIDSNRKSYTVLLMLSVLIQVHWVPDSTVRGQNVAYSLFKYKTVERSWGFLHYVMWYLSCVYHRLGLGNYFLQRSKSLVNHTSRGHFLMIIFRSHESYITDFLDFIFPAEINRTSAFFIFTCWCKVQRGIAMFYNLIFHLVIL